MISTDGWICYRERIDDRVFVPFDRSETAASPDTDRSEAVRHSSFRSSGRNDDEPPSRAEVSPPPFRTPFHGPTSSRRASLTVERVDETDSICNKS
ncbi:hypothetical protein EA472_15895 [Natrarchaeobius oligotrophus]|uniref:Uncharacterized protein n=1 Tax=Natrarchaeobius chitinivorans TaxID=1679083 RepID=A0A3N6PFW0_NATCH|nr:hypothetical protein EA472_15895 [Natrarchaeobius chitinivorans]